MDQDIRDAIAADMTIDMTTIGRRSERPSRIEIWYHVVDGEVYITGLPGRRDWYANLLANPTFTFHLKETAIADLEATATPIKDPAEKRTILEVITERLRSRKPVEEWVARSPLVKVDFSTEHTFD